MVLQSASNTSPFCSHFASRRRHTPQSSQLCFCPCSSTSTSSSGTSYPFPGRRNGDKVLVRKRVRWVLLQAQGCIKGGSAPHHFNDAARGAKSIVLKRISDEEEFDYVSSSSIGAGGSRNYYSSSYGQDPIVDKLRTQLGVIHPIPTPPLSRDVFGLFGFFFLVGVVFDKLWMSRKKSGSSSGKSGTWPQVPATLSMFLEKDLERKESVEWVNMVLGKLWKVYRGGLENWLIGLLQPVIDNLKKPDYVERVVIKQFSLGDEPLSVRSVERRTSRRVNDLQSSVSQTRATFATLFHAFASLGSLQQGQVLHGTLVKTPFSSNIHVGTALVDMYSKCGSISDANMAFSCISSPNVAAWTALINGYADHGLGCEAVSLFNLMVKGEIKPNAATFVAVLSACARAGLTYEGLEIFHSMKENFGITPAIEHFTCVVDLLGRAGLIREAEELIKRMPLEADKIMLSTLLNACWCWMDTDVGERVAEKMFALDQYASSACVIMSNIYSTLEKWADKTKVRDDLRESGGKKDPGCSWIDINNVFHVFSVDDTNHPDFDLISDRLESLTRIAHSDAQIVHQN